MDGSATTSVVCRTRAYRIDARKLAHLAQFVCLRLGVAGHEVNVTLVGAAAIRRLNREFRGIDKATDVLSFPQKEWSKPLAVKAVKRAARKPVVPDVLGDVVISLPQAETNARKIGQPLDREVCFLMVHGILHLCGHDHMKPAEEKRMLAQQRRLMELLARGRSGPLWVSSVKRRRPS